MPVLVTSKFHDLSCTFVFNDDDDDDDDDVETDEADDNEVVGGVDTLPRREAAVVAPPLVPLPPLLLLLLLLLDDDDDDDDDGFALELPFLAVATLICMLRKTFQSSSPISKLGGALSLSQLKMPTT